MDRQNLKFFAFKAFVLIGCFSVPLHGITTEPNDAVPQPVNESIAGPLSIDLDGNGSYDALTDGLLLLRHLYGVTGSELVAGVVATDADSAEPSEIEARIATLGNNIDIDADGNIAPDTDGLIILRFLFGLRGESLLELSLIHI